jgi:hypothetical protein
MRRIVEPKQTDVYAEKQSAIAAALRERNFFRVDSLIALGGATYNLFNAFSAMNGANQSKVIPYFAAAFVFSQIGSYGVRRDIEEGNKARGLRDELEALKREEKS